ncbi:MAG: hypothetical protein ACOX6T_24025 [Myxococcales bacterium]|jgi:hypothetical protein
MKRLTIAVALATAALFANAGCGNDADALGVGAECTSNDQCDSGDEDKPLSCLTAFKGGYCGLAGCKANADCPESSICVTHEDAKNYCFRVCADKADCNANRTAEVESNCSSSITRVEEGTQKACVPPSGK